MRLCCLIILLTCAACASPSPAFKNARSGDINISGDRITVFYTPTHAQAVRTNARNKSQRAGAFARLVQAIVTVSGCDVRPRSVKGDDVLITAALICPKSGI